MGGSVPLGYDVANRELVVNEAEAVTVRDIFDSYVRLSSVADLQVDLQRRGILSKRWTSSSGRTWGGAKFSRGALYWLLRNPVYVGRVAHKGHTGSGPRRCCPKKVLLGNGAPSPQEAAPSPGGCSTTGATR
jgi:site-specific DNA recombinase